MHFGYLGDLFSDPRNTLIFLLLALPGRLMAIAAHEAAHGWVAERCGDPTARFMGRITLNPLKHLDPVGVFMMVVFGFGWARPVPVNPRNFRNYRRDDLLVSIAGITANLVLFLLGVLLMYGLLIIAVMQVPRVASAATTGQELFIASYKGGDAMFFQEGAQRYYLPLADAFRNGIFMSDTIIAPVFGQVAGHLYDMLYYFVVTNMVLAVFNMIPVPPLDGYHVLNDLVLKGNLFAGRQAQGIGMGLLYLGVFTGVLGDMLGNVYTLVLGRLGELAVLLCRWMGLF
ncbi:MAG: site-2 protease family protein [Christensenellales bacterium]|nr:site-2 protease family protein [Christensenellales bacterium]